MCFTELLEKETSRINSPSQPLLEQIVPKDLFGFFMEIIINPFLLNTLHVMQFTSLLSLFVVSTEKKDMFEAINEYFFQIL